MSRETNRQKDKLDELIASIESVQLIGTDRGDFYLEPSGFPELSRELAEAIKPVLIKHRILVDQNSAKVGF